MDLLEEKTTQESVRKQKLAQAASFLEFLTEEVQAQNRQSQELEERGSLYRSVFESVSDAIVVVDERGNIKEANPKTLKMYGKSMKELAGKPSTELFSGQDAYKFSLTIDRCLRLGAESSFKAVHQAPDESLKYLEIQAKPLAGKESGGAVLFIKDVTKNVENNRVLREAKLRAESSDMAKSQFLANISHEVRTPMNIILGYAGLLKNDSLSREERDSFTDHIFKHGNELVKLIDKALEVGNRPTEQLVLEKKSFALFPAVKELVKTYEGNSKVEMLLDFRLPLNQKIYTDKERFLQTLSNLLDNGFKFTKEGAVELCVDSDDNGRVSFYVADTGIGVPRDQWKRLFNPFTQADETFTRDFGGSGLGLAVARHLSKALGGNVCIKSSEQGFGSVFEFWLKDALTVSEETKKKRAPSLEEKNPEKAQEPYKNLRNARILLVEDVKENQALIKHYLKEIQCKVEVACDGKEALEQLSKKSFDLILMDLQMPRLDGFGATDLIRKRGLKTPIIALTAHSMKEDVDRCMKSGFNDHLSKPIAPAKLIGKLNQTLHRVG